MRVTPITNLGMLLISVCVFSLSATCLSYSSQRVEVLEAGVKASTHLLRNEATFFWRETFIEIQCTGSQAPLLVCL